MFLLTIPDDNCGHPSTNPDYRITTQTEGEMQEIILSLYEEQFEKTFNKYINERNMKCNLGTLDKANKFAKNFIKMSFDYIEIQAPCGSTVPTSEEPPL